MTMLLDLLEVPSKIPEPVMKIARVLEEAGEKAWIVGGCIRDLILSREVHDWDLATTARPDKVQSLFHHVIPTGIAHGTVTVMLKGVGYEVTTLRGEGKYTDGRRPDDVQFVDDILVDLERRDFTMNAIAYQPSLGLFEDPFGGLKDIENKIIRAVRDPMLRFSEDGLRVLRAARFASTLDFGLDPETYAAIPKTLGVLMKVSQERVQAEFDKIMTAKKPSVAFMIMHTSGMLGVLVPSFTPVPLSKLFRAFDHLDVQLDRTIQVGVRTALLMAPLGPEEAVATLIRLRYSNDVQKLVRVLVANSNPPDRKTLTRPQARAVMRTVGKDPRLGQWLWFLSASAPSLYPEWAQSAFQEVANGMPFSAADLELRGDEVVKIVGKPGPKVKQILDQLVLFVEEDLANNQTDILREKALSLHAGLD